MKLKYLFAFFPLLIPTWEKAPFNTINTTVPDAPTYADNASVKMQSDYLMKTQDSRLRSRIAITLSWSDNKTAIDALEACLQDEKNDYVQADLLNALYNLRDQGCCKKVTLLRRLLKSEDKSVRTLAAALELRATNDLSSVYNLLAQENSEYVINFLWNEIVSSKDLARHSRDSEIDRFLSSENPCQRTGAIKVAVMKSEDPDKDPKIAKFLSDKSAMVKAAMAQALSSRDKGGTGLLKGLSEDNDASVRAFVASSVPAPDRLQILMKLSDDPDDEVRRLACVSLGEYKDADAIDSLIARLGDKKLQVRDAAEASLVRIAPGQDVLKRIGDELLENSESRASAVTILGVLKDIRYSQAIMKILESLDDVDYDLARRCITALGELDFKESWKPVSERAGHKEAVVREAVASTLGKLKIKDSFDTIIKLSGDKAVNVSAQAFESMGWIADAYFSSTLYMAIKKTVAEYPSDNRASACWSIARINSSSQEILSQLDALCMKMVLKVPMSPNTYDLDSVRISALFAMIDLGRKDPVAKDKAAAILKEFLSPPRNEDSSSLMVGDGLRDFARQAKAYMNDEKPGQMAVRARMPLFIIEELKEKNAAPTPAE
ncbi:MAG: HEAT repeat domain-containing protein [Victivallales bacterium]